MSDAVPPSLLPTSHLTASSSLVPRYLFHRSHCSQSLRMDGMRRKGCRDDHLSYVGAVNLGFDRSYVRPPAVSNGVFNAPLTTTNGSCGVILVSCLFPCSVLLSFRCMDTIGDPHRSSMGDDTGQCSQLYTRIVGPCCHPSSIFHR